MRAVGAQLHRLHGFTCAVLNARDHLFDLAGRLRGAMSQRAYFIGNHSKAPARLASTCRFDGCVQGQQVGLFGDGTNNVQHFADITPLFRQAFDQIRRGLHILSHGLNR